jgi:hypothetical protein
MAFQFTCPYCFKKTLVDESIAGQSGPCASCGKSITVPEPPARAPDAIRPIDNRHVAPRPTSARRKLLAWSLQLASLAVGGLLLAGVCFYLLWPTLEGLKSRRDRVASLNNLQRIATALNEYALAYGSYPPPVVTDATGKPLYSWRVLILEQLGEASLAAAFRKDLPWDSPENVALLLRSPSVFISPTTLSTRTGAEANYALIVGRGTLFPNSGPLGVSDISDGRDQTLLVVETSHPNSEWSKPWDIDISKLNTKIGTRGSNTIGGNHPGGAAVAFADETPGWLPEDLSPALLQALITPAGGEAISPTTYRIR